MNIYSNSDSFCTAIQHSAITIGVFDGCHLGHTALLQKTIEVAHTKGTPAGVFTFSSHPNLLLHPDKPLRLLTSTEQRLHYFEKMGFDFTIILPFDATLRHTSAERFIQRYLLESLAISQLVLGYDSHFGDGRRGDAQLARTLLNPLNIPVHTVEAISHNGPISSSRIRTLLHNADLSAAKELLNRPYSVLGRVGHGDERGRHLGFPTANIHLGFDMPLPSGVWAAEAKLPDGRVYKAAVNWGFRPTFSGKTDPASRLEAYLIGFTGELYGTHLEITFIKYIRAERRFATIDELTTQIREDIEHVKTTL